MKDYLQFIKNDGIILVCFLIEEDKVLEIGDKMNEISEDAYMNGYNWEAFIHYYLKNHHPEILENMETDSEAGTYVAYYTDTPENEKKAEKLAAIIEELVENEARLYEIVRNEGSDINWE